MSRRFPIVLLAALALVLLAVPAGAHGSGGEEADEAGPTPFHDDLIADFQRASDKLVALAEAIPADKYSWRPTEDVRTTSEVFVHVVGTNRLLPMGLGAPPPESLKMPEKGPMALARQWEAEVTEKEEVLTHLRDSIHYASHAMRRVEDLDTEVDLFFPGSKRTYLFVLVTHVHEHLGQAIAYARSMGVVPPWSRPAEGEGEDGH